MTRTTPAFQETSRWPIMSLGLLAVFALFCHWQLLLEWFRHENVTVIAANQECTASVPNFLSHNRGSPQGKGLKCRPLPQTPSPVC